MYDEEQFLARGHDHCTSGECARKLFERILVGHTRRAADRHHRQAGGLREFVNEIPYVSAGRVIDHQRLNSRVESVDIGAAVARLDVNAPFVAATDARTDDRQDFLDVGPRGVAVAKRLEEDVECHSDSLPRRRWMASVNMTWVL